MLPITLLLALVVLAGAHIAARWKEARLIDLLAISGVAVVVGGMFGGLGVFVIALIVLLLWHTFNGGMRTVLPLALLAAGAVGGAVAYDRFRQQANHDRLREVYPLESLATRIPEPPADRRVPLSVAATAEVERFEGKLPLYPHHSTRAYQLQALHERSVNTFVNNPGFGVGRTIRHVPITERGLNHGTDHDPTPEQPGSPALWGSEPFTPIVERGTLVTLHTDGVFDFVNPRGWGYVQSRDRVAGFLPHRFSKVPEAQTWTVQRVELVGLLKHPEPVVYLSDKLPAMAELPNVPTRAPDAFEAAGLERVRQGDDGFAARRGDAVRFVGGIRSAKQCVQCHGGERGDLLGAFSYTLRPKP